MKKILVLLVLGLFIAYGCVQPPQYPPAANETAAQPTGGAQPTAPAAAAAGNASVAWNGTVEIGFVGPLSGNASAYGIAVHRAVQLAAEEINGKGGINGAELKVIASDGACSELLAKGAATALIRSSGVQVIIGGLCSDEVSGMGSVLSDERVVLLSPAATGTKPSSQDFIFRMSGSAAAGAMALSDYAEGKGWRRVAIIAEGTAYPTAFGNAFRSEFNSRGRVITTYQPIGAYGGLNTPAYSVKITGPDAVLVLTQTPARSAEVMKEVRGTMAGKPLMGGEVETMPKAVALAGSDADGLTGLQAAYDADSPEVRAFLASYRAKYGEDCPVPGMAITARDGVYLLAEIIRNKGFTQNNGDVIRNELNNVKGWKGLSGNITFDAYGDADLGYGLATISDVVAQKA